MEAFALAHDELHVCLSSDGHPVRAHPRVLILQLLPQQSVLVSAAALHVLQGLQPRPLPPAAGRDSVHARSFRPRFLHPGQHGRDRDDLLLSHFNALIHPPLHSFNPPSLTLL